MLVSVTTFSGSPVARVPAASRGAWVECQQPEGGDHGEHGRPAECVDQAADGGAGDGADLENRRGGRDGSGKHLGGHEVGQRRRHRGGGKRTSRAGDEEEQVHRYRRRCAHGRPDPKRRQAEGLDEQGKPDDLASIEAVGRMSGDEHHDDIGQELREPDIGETHRVIGRRVDIPANRHVEHL